MRPAPGGRGEGRRGATLVEIAVALLLTTVLLRLSLDALGRIHAAARRHDVTRERLDARRVASLVLRSELSAGAAGVDWVGFPPDSVRLRAFRVAASVCAVGLDSTVTVRVLGGRRVDPAKDSVRLLGADGRWRTAAVLTRRSAPGACDGTAAEVWRLDRLASAAVLVRAFETGSYHLGPAELRYRRGGSGRQPLTGPGLAASTLAGTARRLDLRSADVPLPTRLGPR